MADRYDDVLRRLEELEQKARDAERPQKLVLGTATNPVLVVYLRDERTGSVAKVTYDGDAGTIRTEKVR